ncbi:hypothetical protein HRbin15_00359 [bacterium HR15]|nr:hypothetical protein HRbin15_00359 [bacterium HR15]
MRSAIAIGWLIVALLGFFSGNLLNLSPDDLLARVGMGLYALLLTISLIVAILTRLRRTKGTPKAEGVSRDYFSKLVICFLLFALLMPKLACAQSLDESLNPVFPSRFTAAASHEGVWEYRLEFPSAFVSPYPTNNTVYARWLVPQMSPDKANRHLPVVILLHSLGIRQPVLEMSLARELLRHQIAVLLLTLPYHMERTPPGYDSGDLILQGDVPLLRSALIQAVWDVRRAIDWLARQPEVDPTRIALVGISLGAIMGATALGVEPRLHSAVLILGGVDLAHILWHSILAVRTRMHLREQGYTLSRLREAMADVEPMHRLTPALGEKTFVVGARFDIVVPTEDTEKLIRALGNPRVFWLNTGHFGGALVQRPLFRMIRRYLVARFRGIEPPVEAVPLVPTVRIGAIYSTERDFRLAMGVDIWRSDKRGTLFVTGVLTPRGSSLFAGVRLRLGFSAGVEITARRTTGAIFWHFVL